MAKDQPSRTNRARSLKSKPYERPTSILRKVADTVCHLLPPWLNLQSWTSSSNSDNVETVENDSDDEINEPGPSNIRDESTVTTRLETSDVSRYTRCPLPRTAADQTQQTSVNGDDQSDNSESSASTSGCSSLAPSHQEKKRLLRGLPVTDDALAQIKKNLSGHPLILGKRKKDASVLADLPDVTTKGNETPSSRGSLWSEDEELLLPKRSRPQPISIGNKPSFRLSSFGAPIPPTSIASGLLASPFYQGRTTFGGSSAINTSRFATSRPSMPKVKVCERSSPEFMSSTAKKILNTLERMTTPLSDVKKIPTEKNSVDFALSYTPMSYRRRQMSQNADRTNQISRLGPPVKGIGIPYPTHVVRLPKPFDCTGADPSQAPVTSTPIAPIVSQYPADDTDSRKSGGKIMRQNKRGHYSSKAEDEVVELPILASVPLPITSMPRFSFAATSTPVTTPSDLSRSGEPLFSFASPIQHEVSSANVPISSVSQGEPFTFSVPAIISGGKRETKCVEKVESLPETNFVSVASVVAKPIRKEEDEAKNESGLKAASELIIGGSVMDILGVKKSPAVVEKTTTTNPTSGFGSKFNPPVGNWTCATCMISNGASIAKCVACETPKPNGTTSNPSGFGNKFNPPVGNWTCAICMISNASACVKCAACETPKPGLKTTSLAEKTLDVTTTNVGSKFVPSANSWECDTCLVPNKKESNKCVACETPRSNSQKATGVSATFTGFKFGNLSKSVSTSSSPASFKFGTSEIGQDATTTLPATFKFGSTNQESSFGLTEPSKPVTMVFGGTQSETTNLGFKFGSSAKEVGKTDVKSEEKSIAGSGFKFGLPAADSTSSDVKPSDALKFGLTSGKSLVSEGSAKPDVKTSVGFTFGGFSKPTPAEKSSGLTFGTPVKPIATLAATVAPSSATTFGTNEPAVVATIASLPRSESTSSAFKLSSTDEFKTSGDAFKFGAPAAKTSTETTGAPGDRKAASDIPKMAAVGNIFGQAGKNAAAKFGESFAKPTGIAVQLSNPLKSTNETSSIPPFAGFQANTCTTAPTTTTAPFNFFAKPKTDVKTIASSDFNFGQAPKTDSAGPKASARFTFGTKASAVSTVGATTTATNTTANQKPAFVFTPTGFSAANAPKLSVPDLKVVPQNFTFGTPAAPKFDFGQPKSEAPAVGGFTFNLGSDSAPAVTSATPFGGFGATTAAPSTTGGFSFGAPPSTTSAFNAAPTPLFGSQSGFGAYGSGTPAFGQPQEIPFGSNTTTTPGFQFNPSSSDSSLFRFGAQQQPDSTASAGFGFGNVPTQPAAPPTNPGFNFNPSATVPSFNFGSQQPQPSSTPFQFTSSSENIFNPGSIAGPQNPERRIRRAVRRSRK